MDDFPEIIFFLASVSMSLLVGICIPCYCQYSLRAVSREIFLNNPIVTQRGVS